AIGDSALTSVEEQERFELGALRGRHVRFEFYCCVHDPLATAWLAARPAPSTDMRVIMSVTQELVEPRPSSAGSITHCFSDEKSPPVARTHQPEAARETT